MPQVRGNNYKILIRCDVFSRAWKYSILRSFSYCKVGQQETQMLSSSLGNGIFKFFQAFNMDYYFRIIRRLDSGLLGQQQILHYSQKPIKQDSELEEDCSPKNLPTPGVFEHCLSHCVSIVLGTFSF